jgi:hypothetical protein
MKNFKLFFLLIAVFPKLAFTQIYYDVGCSAPNPTFCLGKYSNKLIYGGYDTICNVKINKIGAWNDTVWSSFGNGITPPTVGYPARAFAEYNGDLIVGGGFQFASFKNVNKIARWDGTDWYPMGTGLNGQFATELLSSLIVYKGELYAAGRFNEINGIKNVNNIARWDGTTWRKVGTGLQGSLPEVYSMAVYKDELYVGGNFIQAGPVTAYNIAKWNGTTWSAVGLGTSSDVNVLHVDTLRDLLYVGGDFDGVNNAIYSSKVAMWDGANWNSMSPNNFFGSTVVAMEMYHGYLYAGGYKFSDTCFARWDGVKWEVIKGPNSNVTSLQTYNDELYIGGSFTKIGTDSIQYLARYYSTDSVVVGIQNHKKNKKMRLYPNPTNKILNIESETDFEQFTICNIFGQELIKNKWQENKIDISTLPSGVYILKLKNRDYLIQERFVKE